MDIYLFDSNVQSQYAKQWLVQEAVWWLSVAFVSSNIVGTIYFKKGKNYWPL